MDLHIHSSYSFDCKVPPKEIVKEAKKKGLDIIGITDHGTREGGLEVKDSKGIRVLVGQEVKTKHGDILVFNVDTDIEEGEDIVKTCKKVKGMNGFIVIPHPFDPLRQVTGKNTDKIAKYADAIEGFNPKCFFDWSNKKAENFANKHGLPSLASSDAHKMEEVGRAYTMVEGDDIFQAIRDGRVSMVKGKVSKKDLVKKRVKKVLGK